MNEATWHEIPKEELPQAAISMRWRLSEDGRWAHIEEVWDKVNPKCPFELLDRK